MSSKLRKISNFIVTESEYMSIMCSYGPAGANHESAP